MTEIYDEIASEINKKFQKHRLWVWYDPRHKYEGILEDLKGVLDDDITMLIYDGSYMELKYKLWKEDPDLDGKWLLYVSENRRDAEWMRDIHKLGKEYRPTFNISDDPAAQYLSTRTDRIPAEFENNWNTDEEPLSKAFFSVLFGKPHFTPRDFIIDFLARPNKEPKNFIDIIERYKQEAVWSSIIEKEYGIDAGLDTYKLAKQIVFSELHYYSPVGQYKKLTAGKVKETADLCRHWQRVDPKTYLKYINKIAQDYDIKDAVIDSDTLDWNSTAFKGVDEGLLHICIKSLLDMDVEDMSKKINELIPTVKKRKDNFWHNEGYTNYWSVLDLGFEVFQGAHKALGNLDTGNYSLDELLASYLERWWMIDNRYRKYVNAMRDLMHPYDDLDDLGHRFTRLYTRYLKELNRIMTDMIPEQPFIGELQNQFFNGLDVSEGTAVIICDALRYELAKDIVDAIEDIGADVDLKMMSSTLPSMTDYGMASLLPGRLSYDLNDGISVKVDDELIKNKKDRVDILESKGFLVSDIHSILSERMNSFKDKGIPPRVVYSQYIDEIGETLDRDEQQVLANITGHVKEVSRLIRRMKSAGYHRFYITSDHGFLYTEELPDELKVDPPSEASMVKRRFAVIKDPDFSSDRLITLNQKHLSKLKIRSDKFTLAFPYGVACFKARGGNVRFLHGGISLQELAIPLLEIKIDHSEESKGKIDIEVNFPTRITNSIITIELIPKGQISLLKSRTVVLQARVGDKQVCEPKKVVVDTKKTERLRLKTGLLSDDESVVLEAIDEETQEMIGSHKAEVDLIIHDDMGFDI